MKVIVCSENLLLYYYEECEKCKKMKMWISIADIEMCLWWFLLSSFHCC